MFKAPTQPADPVAGVLEVMGAAARVSGVPLAEYLARGEILVHGTTHAINAIVTGSNRANRLPYDGGPSGHAGLSGRRPAGRL